jgi:hypothetical protein
MLPEAGASSMLEVPAAYDLSHGIDRRMLPLAGAADVLSP